MLKEGPVSYRLGTLFDRTERLPPAIVAVGLALLGAVAFLPGLGRAPFYHLVEGDQALVVQTIVYDHEWLLPKLNDDTLPSKPPLFNWLGAIASIVAGEMCPGPGRVPSPPGSSVRLALVGAPARG